MKDLNAEWYDSNAAEFCARTIAIDMDESRSRFLRHVPPGGRLLDVGCGSGRDSRRFVELGYEVEARDRSSVMVAEARRLTGLPVVVEDVLEMRDVAAFDGIWACAMLLHFEESEFRVAVQRLARALKPNGALFISLKQGERVSNGDSRTFRFWSLDAAIAELCVARSVGEQHTHFELAENWVVREAGPREVCWVNVVVRKRA
jgi:SAM-dependent methyltransferase